jgi:hypothetical protein
MIFIYSCVKEESVEIKDGISSNRVSEISEGTTLPYIRDMPTVVSGILKFKSKQHLREFWEDIDTASVDQLNLIEQTLEFTSLRSIYYDVEDSGAEPINEFPFVVNDPFDAMVFNQYHELWVGDDIYKFVDKRLIAKTTSDYISEIIDMRGNGGMVRENIELLDMNTKGTLPEPPVSNRTKCTMIVTVPANPTSTNGGNSLYGYVQPIIIDQNGNRVSACGGNISIDWGDGNTSFSSNENINGIRAHVYNVGPGECEVFMVKITLTLTLCGICTEGGNQTIITSQNINFCNPLYCTPFENSVDEKEVLRTTYASNTRLAIFKMGYNSDDYLWHDARAWGRIQHFSKNPSNGKITGLINPGFDLRIWIHGFVYSETCNGTRNEADQRKIKKTADLENMYKLDDVNFRLRSDDDLYADFEVFGTSNTVPNVTLYNRPFSTL